MDFKGEKRTFLAFGRVPSRIPSVIGGYACEKRRQTDQNKGMCFIRALAIFLQLSSHYYDKKRISCSQKVVMNLGGNAR